MTKGSSKRSFKGILSKHYIQIVFFFVVVIYVEECLEREDKLFLSKSKRVAKLKGRKEFAWGVKIKMARLCISIFNRVFKDLFNGTPHNIIRGQASCFSFS